jgi:hypothetical protein
VLAVEEAGLEELRPGINPHPWVAPASGETVNFEWNLHGTSLSDPELAVAKRDLNDEREHTDA